MALSREEYLAVCERCIKRKMDFDKGLVCSLTGEHAAFESECPSYEKDQLQIDRLERMKKEKEAESKQVFATETSMMNSGFIGGILLIAGGVVWLIAGFAMNRLFFYPIIMIIGGIVALIKASAKKAKEMQKRDMSHILDDKKELEDL